jgi:hypothetical protein
MTTGLIFPLEIQNGNLRTGSGDELTASQIRHVLLTVPKEILMRPAYGVTPKLFEPVQQGTTKREVEAELRRRIPSTKFNVQVTLEPTEGGLLIEVFWVGSDGRQFRESTTV